MQPKIYTTELAIPYKSEPLSLFSNLAKTTSYSVLLESAEIDSKDHLKSLMLIDAGLRMECNGYHVEIKCLKPSLTCVFEYLKNELHDFIESSQDQVFVVKFDKPLAGLSETERLTCANPFSVLRLLHELGKNQGNHSFSTFIAGVFGYDLIGMVEDLPQVPQGKNACPDYVFYLAESLLLTDHQQQSSEIIYNQFGEKDPHARPHIENIAAKLLECEELGKTKKPNLSQDDVVVDKSDEEFKQDVINLKEHIRIGNIFQVVPSRTFSLPCPQPIDAYRKLKQQNPSPYMFYVKDKNFELFGASPESAVKYTAEPNLIEVYPIAGTRRRGFNEDGSINLDLDSRIEQELRSDKKELSEHMMLVDLARNDIARVAKPGTRYVSDLQKVDRYSFVMHLVSRVVGDLKEELDPLHAYQACLNMGTLVGAPKIMAAGLIRETEKHTRGSYGGAVGYLAANGDMDTCIVIRSAFVAKGVAHVQAGAGVVFDSDPQSEADETRSKAQAVINAIIASQEVNRG
ncbi:anthranilate synthase component I [Saccharobesus litoralis]|uniref:Anthranilate synthase component 1 n=1 Tax=Saccharobesus litoralis TaxID=2172099 RepID=A0A2S0VU65_9ALTE|nr:anthranilate synthase component 1 [Saccharobesus litoralis]AWB67712.1 anthranilate synthase component I [Saccharobesus litoralis]